MTKSILWLATPLCLAALGCGQRAPAPADATKDAELEALVHAQSDLEKALADPKTPPHVKVRIRAELDATRAAATTRHGEPDPTAKPAKPKH